jgi:ubiquinone biosynthesis protein
VLPDGRLAAVDFGIMGRLDADSRQFLADMLLAFLTGNYRRAAEVHFEAGFVPYTQSIDHFAQACRAIGTPVLGKPLRDISLGRLLGQLFKVTEQFEMQTQPHLLLLQKSMLTAEGVSRTLSPDANMWAVAQPLIEDWMRAHRGPEARLAQAGRALADGAATLPRLVREAERAMIGLAEWTDQARQPSRVAWFSGAGWVLAALLAGVVIAHGLG